MEHKLGRKYFLTLAPSSNCLGASHIVGQRKEKATLLSNSVDYIRITLYAIPSSLYWSPNNESKRDDALLKFFKILVLKCYQKVSNRD